MKIKIRKATKKDSNTIISWNRKMAFETENKNLNLKTSKLGVDNFFKQKGLGFYLIAEADNKPVGQLMITYEWSDWRNGLFYWIQSVYVVPEFRGKKIFSALYRYVFNLTKKNKNICGIRLYVENNNKRAQKVYVKLGLSKTHYQMFETDFVL